MSRDRRFTRARLQLAMAIGLLAACCTVANAAATDNLELLGTWGGWIEEVAVQGSLAFLAEGSELQIVDCADPTDIQPIARTILDDPINVIAADWGRVAVATRDVITIFDVSDPRTPIELVKIEAAGGVEAVEMRGSSLYVAGRNYRAHTYGAFAVYDISDVERPVLMDQLNVDDEYIAAMGIEGDRAYLLGRRSSDAHVLVVDISNPEELVQTTTYAPPGFVARALCSEGDRVYVGGVTDNNSLVHVLDVSVPDEPDPLAVFPLQEAIPALPGVFVAANANLYVGAYYTLDIYDVSDPAIPIVAASMRTERLLSEMVIHGGRAYLADGTAGLQVYGINDIAPPVEVGSLDLMDSPYGVVLHGDIALVPMGSSGLQLVDVSDPQNAVELMRIPALDAIWNVEISGDLIAIEDQVTRLIDLSNPLDPIERGTVEGELLELDGAYLYTKEEDNTLQVHDVSDPGAPSLVKKHLESGISFIDLEIRGDLIYACADDLFRIYRRDAGWSLAKLGELSLERMDHKVLVSGDTAYLAGRDQLMVVDVGVPSSPVVRGSCMFSWSDNISTSGELAMIGSSLLVPMSRGGLQVVDVGRADRPVLVWRMDLPDHTKGVAVQGAIAVVAPLDYGVGGSLTFLDFTDVVEPQLVGQHPAAGNPYRVDVSDGMAFVGDRYGDLTILDVRVPHAIQEWATVDLENPVVSVDVENSVAYAAVWYVGVAIIDASDPAAPVEIAQISAIKSALDVAVADAHLYVAGRPTYDGRTHQDGLSIYDVSNPANPDSLGVLNFGRDAIVVEVRDNVAYVGVDDLGDDTLRLVDVSDPTNPVELSSLTVGDKLKDVALVGDHAVVSTGVYGQEMLHVIDVTDPVSPIRVGGLELPTEAQLSVEGTTVYAAVGYQGVAVIDVSDPTDPVLVTSAAVSGNVYDVHAEGGIQYAAANTAGLVALRADGAESPVEIGRYAADDVVDVAMSGTLAVTVDEGRGLRVIDVADPDDPVELGSVYAGEVAYLSRVETFGRHAYWTGDGGFRVIDIGDPFAPAQVGEFVPGPTAQEAQVRGHVVTPASVFMAASDGLRVVDVRDPRHPEQIALLGEEDDCQAIDLHGNTAFVLIPYLSWPVRGPGIWVVDVSDPAGPTGIGSIGIDRSFGSPVDIQVEDRAIYVGTRDGEVLVFRRTSSDTAELVATLSTHTSILQMQLVGSVLYLASGEDGFVMVDVTHLENPRIAGAMDTEKKCRAVDVFGGLACLANEFLGLRLVDVRDAEAPRLLGSYESSIRAGAVTVADGLAYVIDITDDDEGIHVVDVSDPARIREAEARRDVPGIHDIDLEGSTLCWLAPYELRVADVSGEWDPLSASARTLYGGRKVEVAGGIAHVAFSSISSGLALVDVSDPSALQTLDSVSLPEFATDLEVDEGMVFVATTESSSRSDSPGQVIVVDATDPRALDVLDSVEFSRAPQGMFARGDMLFVGFDDSLAVLDVSEPAAPILIDSTSFLGQVRALDGSEDMIFVAHSNGVRAFSWDRANGFEERDSVWRGRPLDLEVADGMIYVASDQDGLQVLRLVPTVGMFPGDTDNNGFVDALDVLPLGVYFGATGPARVGGSRSWSEQPVRQWVPAAATHADTDGDGVVDERDLLAIGLNWGERAATSGPTYVIDRTDPRLRGEASASLTQLYRSLPASGESSLAMGALLEQILGLEVIPRRYDLLQNEPNPFNPMTTIRFDLPGAAEVRLQIYDLRGRLVATLLDDVWYPPGRHNFDFRPQSLASGVYIYRIESDLGVRTRKMSVLK